MPKSHRRSSRDRFNRVLTSGSLGGIAGLGIAALVLVVLGAAFASIFHVHAGEANLSVVDAGWEILQRAIDPGQLDGELQWESRILLLVITALGILLVSTLISIVNSTIERRIEKLRRGRGPVEASDHIAILGWNRLGTKVTEELAEAYVDAGAMEVVILADNDPLEIVREVQEDLRRRRSISPSSHIVKRPETWLTVRRGDLRSVSDLGQLARLETAKSVIVLGDDRTDAETTMIVLAIVASIQTPLVTRKSPLQIVASFTDTELAVRLKHRIHLLSVESERAGEPIAELIPVTPKMVRTGIESQVARHRGLSEVYRDLLDFDGDELYIVPAPKERETFGAIVDSPGVVVVGLISDEDVDLWPSWGSPLKGRSVVVLARTLEVAHDALCTEGGLVFQGDRPAGTPAKAAVEEILIIGWNSAADHLVRSLLSTTSDQSQITVLVHAADNFDRSVTEQFSQVVEQVRIRTEDPLDDREFIERFDHVIVLAHDELDAAQSDATVLADVLACRIQAEGSSRFRTQPTTVVAELRQPVSKNIAGVRLADDLLLSDSLGASAMAQLAVNPHLLPVLSAILESDSPNHVQLMSIEGRSSQFIGRTWEDVRRSLMSQTGELAVAVRYEGVSARVVVNPSASYVVRAGEEIIVFGRYVP